MNGLGQHFIWEQVFIACIPKIDQDERPPQIFNGSHKLAFAWQRKSGFLRPNGSDRFQCICRIRQKLPLSTVPLQIGRIGSRGGVFRSPLERFPNSFSSFTAHLQINRHSGSVFEFLPLRLPSDHDRMTRRSQ